MGQKIIAAASDDHNKGCR